MGDFASGKNAKAICDVCGLTFKLKELKELVVNRRSTNVKACGECWSPDHPQLHIGELRIRDPQALQNPRPDTGATDGRNIAWGWNPCYAVFAEVKIGQVSV